MGIIGTHNVHVILYMTTLVGEFINNDLHTSEEAGADTHIFQEFLPWTDVWSRGLRSLNIVQDVGCHIDKNALS